MGREFIHWVRTGEQVVIGNIGTRVLVAKLSAAPTDPSEVGRELATRGDRRKIFKRAAKAAGRPEKRLREVSDFVRDAYVVAAALLRANDACEMPGCSRELFKRENGTIYLEVHHIIPLAEDGEDSLDNAAALCPACHRELHYGSERLIKRRALTAGIAAKIS
jgi:5-methylcytosine-specific restriction endonuclease McrA